MFVKPILKYNKTTREYYHVYRLCESVRRNGRIHHQKIIGLGKLEELSTDEQIKLLGSRIEALILNGGQTLPLDIIDSKIEKLAVHFYQEIIKQRRYDVVQGQGEWETVDISTLSNKDDVEIGAEWLCKQAFDQLGIGKFLKEQNWCDEKINLATTHIISRAVYPASEYKTVRFIKQNSGISELTGYDKEKITKDLLYGISHKLYSIRSQLSQYLSKRTNELFDLEDTIILYDLTNVHFEGKMRHSKIARFGKDKKKRKDVKIVALAVVINKEGMLKYANIFQGNIADCKTLKTMIETISCQTSFTTRKLLIVMDAGIATDDNIKMLKKSGYDYICVTRSKLKDFYADKEGELVSIKDKKKQTIELLKIRVAKDNDCYLWVKSYAKGLKEDSMNGLLSQRFEEGIQQINASLSSKSGVKRLDKVHQRIGRLMQKYPRVHKYYNIIVSDNRKGTATEVKCTRKTGEDNEKKPGIYFLRTSLNGKDEKTLWDIYNVIREIEYTFRVLKTDLNMRPIFHKTDDASMAHLHLGLLAYWIASTIRYQLKQKGFNSEWREIVRIMNTQKCVTTNQVNIRGEIISVRKCTDIIEPVKEIYDLMHYKYMPFKRKKSVVPPGKLLKICCLI